MDKYCEYIVWVKWKIGYSGNELIPFSFSVGYDKMMLELKILSQASLCRIFERLTLVS